jgi:hypothetical protein
VSICAKLAKAIAASENNLAVFDDRQGKSGDFPAIFSGRHVCIKAVETIVAIDTFRTDHHQACQ